MGALSRREPQEVNLPGASSLFDLNKLRAAMRGSHLGMPGLEGGELGDPAHTHMLPGCVDKVVAPAPAVTLSPSTASLCIFSTPGIDGHI